MADQCRTSDLSIRMLIMLQMMVVVRMLMVLMMMQMMVVMMMMMTIDNDDDRLVGRRPGDVASCFASAGKVLPPFIIILLLESPCSSVRSSVRNKISAAS